MSGSWLTTGFIFSQTWDDTDWFNMGIIPTGYTSIMVGKIVLDDASWLIMGG